MSALASFNKSGAAVRMQGQGQELSQAGLHQGPRQVLRKHIRRRAGCTSTTALTVYLQTLLHLWPLLLYSKGGTRWEGVLPIHIAFSFPIQR